MGFINFVLRTITYLAIFIVAVFVLGYLSLIFLGEYLTPSDTLKRADAIVVLSGGPDRVQWGIKLYQDGWAPRLVLVGAALDKSGPSNAEAMRKIALRAGVPDTAIFLEEDSTNTLENATFGKAILDSFGAKSIILVTSPYHQRRAYETFKKVYEGEAMVIINSPSGYSTWNAKEWWARPSSTDLTTSELLKIIWAKLTGEFS
ncbi:MAG TPA: YdcF family protein [Patescibacteria group bacterium]|nr:YdcF family protein [Patescibacteria group bacterium]